MSTTIAQAATVTLTHGELVRLASWSSSYASVGSVEGYTASYQGDVARALERAQANGHELAWTVNVGASLVADGGAYYARENARVAGATILEDGQRVLIEGRPYRVRVVPGNAGEFPKNSDPIKFVPLV
jgi:hypothetical protein